MDKSIDNALNWGIIGTGRIAEAFAQALNHTESGYISGVASRNQDSSKQFAHQNKIENSYTGYQQLIDDKKVEAIYIATPHPMHKEWAIKAAESGKHILCEKPMALNTDDTIEIIEAAESNDVFLMEAFMYRCHPQTTKLVELIRQHAIGDVKLIKSTLGHMFPYDPTERHFAASLGGGGILDLGCYPVSMARLIAAVSLGVECIEPIELRAFGHIGAEIGVDKYTSAILLFKNDIIAEISCGITLDTGGELRIYGTEGQIFIPDPWFCGGIDGGQSSIQISRKDEKLETIKILPNRGLYTIEAEHVTQNIQYRQAKFPGMRWSDSIANMKTLDRWRNEIGLKYPQESQQ